MGLALLILAVNAVMAWRLLRRPFEPFHVTVVAGWSVVTVLVLPILLAVSRDPALTAQFKADLTTQLNALQGAGGALDANGINAMLKLMPGLVLMGVAFMMMADAAGLRWLLHRTGRIPRPRPLLLWSVPEGFLALVLLPLLALAWRSAEGGPLLDGAGVLALNILLLALPPYFLQGAMVVQSRLFEAGFKVWMTVLFWTALAFLPLAWRGAVILGLAGLGLLDTWFDFRRLRAPAEGEAS